MSQVSILMAGDQNMNSYTHRTVYCCLARFLLGLCSRWNLEWTLKHRNCKFQLWFVVIRMEVTFEFVVVQIQVFESNILRKTWNGSYTNAAVSVSILIGGDQNNGTQPAKLLYCKSKLSSARFFEKLGTVPETKVNSDLWTSVSILIGGYQAWRTSELIGTQAQVVKSSVLAKVWYCS